MAKGIQTNRNSAVLAMVLVLALAACGGSRPTSGAAGVSDQTRPADTEYCSQHPICFQPGFADSTDDGTRGTTGQSETSYCSAEGTICIQRW